MSFAARTAFRTVARSTPRARPQARNASHTAEVIDLKPNPGPALDKFLKGDHDLQHHATRTSKL